MRYRLHGITIASKSNAYFKYKLCLRAAIPLKLFNKYALSVLIYSFFSNYHSSDILRDISIDYKLIYKPNDDNHDYPFCKLKL